MAVPQGRVGHDVVGRPVGVVVDDDGEQGEAVVHHAALGDGGAVGRPHRHRDPGRPGAGQQRPDGGDQPAAAGDGCSAPSASKRNESGPRLETTMHAVARRHRLSGGRVRGRHARTSVAWGRSSWRGRLRWIRTPRSTWARAPGPELLGHVDEQAELDAVAVGEPDLLEDPAMRRRLAGQRLAYLGELGEEQLEHRSGHQLGDAAPAGGIAVQRAGVEALHQRDVVEEQERSEHAGDEGGRRVGHIRIEEDDQVAVGRRQRGRHGLPLAAVRFDAPHHPGPGVGGLLGRVVGGAVVEHETSSTRPFPPAEARNGCTTARTTEPTVDPSSRAGMHTETVRPALASSTLADGKSPWWKVRGLAPPPSLRPGMPESWYPSGRRSGGRPAPRGVGTGGTQALPLTTSSRATEGRARRRRGNRCTPSGGNRCQCPIDEEDRWSILSLVCVVGNVRARSPPRRCTSATTASGRSRWPTTTSASPPRSPGSASSGPGPSGATGTCSRSATRRRSTSAPASPPWCGPTAWRPSSGWASCGSRTTRPTRPGRSRTGWSRSP
jgi:hypothetical protein